MAADLGGIDCGTLYGARAKPSLSGTLVGTKVLAPLLDLELGEPLTSLALNGDDLYYYLAANAEVWGG